ncbi:MAG: DUF624 domain-containing protein, partial [Oscillospiraceae bacterium]
IPVLCAIALMVVLFILPIPRFEMRLQLADSTLQLKLWEMYVVPMPLMLLSPFFAGMMVVARRLANEEYAFIWSEYWAGVKGNWKQALLNGVFLYSMYFLLSFAFLYYSANLSAGFLGFIPYAMIILLTVLLVFSQYYVPLMIVSVNLKLTHIYKNAFIFAIMGLGRNLLLTLIFVILLGLYLFIFPMMGLTILIGFVLAILLLFAFIAYALSFISYPMIKNYIIAPYEQKEIVKNNPDVQPSNENLDYLPDELDIGSSEKDTAQYVYINGKLVKQDSDEDEDNQIFKD